MAHRQSGRTGAQRYRDLLAINRLITGSLDYHLVLSSIAEQAARLLHGEAAVLLLRDVAGELGVVATYNVPTERTVGLRLPVGPGVMAAIRQLCRDVGLTVFVGVPLVLRGETVGMLAVYGRSRRQPAATDEDLLSALADQAAIAIENARLYAELQRRTAEAEAAHEEAEARARQLETTIEAVPDGVVVADRQGNVVAANSALAALLGFADRKEALRPIADYQYFVQFFYPDGHPVLPEEWGIMQVLRGERLLLRDVRLRLRDGRERLLESSASPVLDERGEVVQAVMVSRDVTEQRRWVRHREVLSRVGQALSQRLELETVLQTVVDQTVRVLGADVAAVLLADPARQELVLVAHRNLRPETVHSVRQVPFDTPLLTARAFATGETQVVEDVSQMGADLTGARTLAEMEGVRSVVAVPLLAAGRSVGAMTFGTRTPRRFAAEDLETVAQVAELFGMAIENARLYEESRRRAEELEEERRRREQFTSVVAHELRAPMTILLGYSGLLRRAEGLAPDRRGEVLNVMVDQVRKLNRLVTDLLDFSRIEAGRFAVERTPMDLVALVRQVAQEQQATTTHHRLMLVALDGTLEGNWDRDRVAQALTNLVSNAIKYSPEGGEVRVAVRRADGEAVVSVSDQGIGIAREDIPLLFQPYSRLFRERQVRGVGLGLFITKGILDAHGGRLWVESEPGKGSTFFFSLPMV